MALTLGAICATGCATADRGRATFSVNVSWTGDGLTGRRITTEHFDIYSTLHDEELESALPSILEAAYRRFSKDLPTPDVAGERLTVYVLGTRGEWDRFTRVRYPDRYEVYSRIRHGGYTEGDTSVSFYTDRSATVATLVHEAWHQYLGSRFDGPIPAWIHEGLACYHESLHLDGAKPVFTPRRNTFRINRLRDAVQSNALLTIRELVETDAGVVLSQDHSRITDTYYAQAWALILFLRHDPAGQRAGDFDQMLADLADGTFRVKLGAAKLGAADPSAMSAGAAAFQAYFGASEALADAYYDFMVRLCGY